MPTLILGDKQLDLISFERLLLFLFLFQWLHFKRTLKNQFEGNTKGHWDLDKVNKTAL